MKFLGLRLCEHDSNLAFSDGTRVQCYKSERHNQIKHHGYNNLVEWGSVLKRWNVTVGDLDAVAIVIDSECYPGLPTPDHSVLSERYRIASEVFEQLRCPVFRVDHHYAHKLSLWPLGVEEPDVDFVFDGFGDDKRSHSIFRGHHLERFATTAEAESIGRLFGSLGTLLGMKGDALDFAGKLMGLKSHGKIEPSFLKTLKGKTVYDMVEIFSIENWINHVGDKTRARETWVDWLATIHHHCEQVFPAYFLQFAEPSETIGYSGGIAQNTVINSEIKKALPDLHIPPHCPDEGLSLGCIEFLRREFDQPPFDRSGFPFWEDDIAPDTEPSDQTIDEVAELLAQGKIVGWYQGKGEIGPRALGNRSILMDPTLPDGKDILNAKVKHREPYRPFGGSVLSDRVSDCFDWSEPSPYMLFVMDVLEPDRYPAITHVDGTCRPQTVPEHHEHFYRLIDRFREKTGIPILLNTSLNNAGAPIAGKPQDARKLLKSSEMDALVVGDVIQ